MQHYSICFLALEIYVKSDTLVCWSAKVWHWLWCCIRSPNIQ